MIESQLATCRKRVRTLPSLGSHALSRRISSASRRKQPGGAPVDLAARLDEVVSFGRATLPPSVEIRLQALPGPGSLLTMPLPILAGDGPIEATPTLAGYATLERR